MSITLEAQRSLRKILSSRYASSGVALFLTSMVGTIALVASYKVQGVKARPAYILVTVSTLMVIIHIFTAIQSDHASSVHCGNLQTGCDAQQYRLSPFTWTWLAVVSHRKSPILHLSYAARMVGVSHSAEPQCTCHLRNGSIRGLAVLRQGDRVGTEEKREKRTPRGCGLGITATVRLCEFT